MLFLSVGLTLTLFFFTDAGITCRDMQNRPVDWFVVYKLPQLTQRKRTPFDPLVVSGYGQLYMDVNNQRWINPNVSLADNNHAIAYTLAQLYDGKLKDNFYGMYNDEKPEPDSKVTSSKGHTKGVVNFDLDSGYWMVHSTPKFPNENIYGWPESARRYGQSFLCVSYPTTALNDLGKQLILNDPWLYSYKLPDIFMTKFPSLGQLIVGRGVKSAPYTNNITVASLGGTTFNVFAKFKKFGKDLYYDWLAPTLRSSLYTETWMNGPGDLPSDCTGEFTVQNIANVQLPVTKFKSSNDHSKWAVSANEANPFVCIGDINRQTGQLGRSGGTVCLRNVAVWNAFKSAALPENCPV